MITAVSLVNTHHLTWLPRKLFFLWWGLLKVLYSLNNFQICNMLLLTIATICPLHSLDLFNNWKFVPADPLHPFLPPPPFWQSPICSLYLWAWICFCLGGYCFICFRFTYKWAHMVFVCLHLISLSICPPGTPCCKGQDSFFLWLNDIPLCYACVYVYTNTYVCVCITLLSIHLSVDT